MEPLVMGGSETMPRINFNARTGTFQMGGVAIPEDVRDITGPVLKWMDEYNQSPKPATELIFDFEYLNTAATKFVFLLCEKLNDLHGQNNCRVKLVWKYSRGDIEMLELGEEVLDGFECITSIVAVDDMPQ